MRSYLENIDIFSYKINFNYKNKDVYHSFFGIGLSFILYFSMFFFFYYFSYDFFFATNPKVIYQETEYLDNISFPLKSFMNNLEYSYKFYVDKPIYEFSFNNTLINNSVGMSQSDYYRNMNIKYNLAINSTFNFFTPVLIFFPDKQDQTRYEIYTFINLFRIETYELPFTLSKYNSVVYKSFSNLNITKYYFNDFKSVKKNKILVNKTIIDFSGKSNIQQEYETFIDFDKINIKITADSAIKFGFDFHDLLTKELKKINKFHLLNFNYNFNYLDYIINISKNNIFRDFSNLFANTLSLGTGDLNNGKVMSKIFSINFGVVKVIEDFGLIFLEKKVNYTVKKNYESLVSLEENIIDGFFSVFEVSFNKVMKQYERIYKKLQNVFADIGGIFSSLILMGNIIICQFNKKKFDYDLINHLYRVENGKDMILENNDISPIKIQNQFHINASFNDKYKNNNFNENSFRDFIYNKDTKQQKIIKFIDDLNSNCKLKSDRNINHKINNGFNIVSKENNVSINLTDRKSLLNISQKQNKIQEKNIVDNSYDKNFDNVNDLIKPEKDDNLSLIFLKPKLNTEPNSFIFKKDNHNYIKAKEFEILENFTIKKNKEEEICQTTINSNIKNKVQLLLKNYNCPNKNIKKFIKFSKLEFFKTFLCCNKIKNQSLINREILFEKASNKIYEYLDILNFASFNENFEKLKSIIFNEHQAIFFDFLRCRDINDIFKENYENKICSTIKYFHNKIKSNKLDLYDIKMKSLLQKEFKDLVFIK